MMKFKPTRKEYRLADESGYSFDVVLVYDDEYGWNAHVSFAVNGYQHEQAAIARLRETVKEFLRMSEEVEP